ncbi:hypothetical protein ACQ4PT_070932 [Festuca glaucescens]
MPAAPTATGVVRVEKVRGRSAVTRCFAKYPLKIIVPLEVYAQSQSPNVNCKSCVPRSLCLFSDGQVHVQVYKAVGLKCSEQVLEATVGKDALFAVIPDPVTCFSTARYYQKQVFHVSGSSNLVLVDWFTSGRYESGETWDFNSYKSVNHILSEEDHPLFIDSVLLEQGSNCSIAERMQEYNVVAMVVLLGPKLKHIQDQMQDEVKNMMSVQLRPPTSGGGRYATRPQPLLSQTRPPLIASCSPFGHTVSLRSCFPQHYSHS